MEVFGVSFSHHHRNFWFKLWQFSIHNCSRNRRPCAGWYSCYHCIFSFHTWQTYSVNWPNIRIYFRWDSWSTIWAFRLRDWWLNRFYPVARLCIWRKQDNSTCHGHTNPSILFWREHCLYKISFN